jgi:hypothetical protein
MTAWEIGRLNAEDARKKGKDRITTKRTKYTKGKERKGRGLTGFTG